MSIEELLKAVIVALEANTKAVNLLEASLVGRTPNKSADKPKAEAKDPDETKVISAEEKKAFAEAKAAAKAEKEAASTAEVQQAATHEQNATSYETLRELVLKLAGSGKREEIKAVSAKHGITAPKDLLKDPADMSTVTDQAKLEAIYADLLALEA